jgi:hypothetical protein
MSGYYQAAHDIVAGNGHKDRLRWMDANGIAGMSTSPDGATRLTYRDGREISGMACHLLPVHLQPKG